MRIIIIFIIIGLKLNFGISQDFITICNAIVLKS
jgi:hypothetical protein